MAALVCVAPQVGAGGPAGTVAVAWVDDQADLSLRQTLREFLAQRSAVAPEAVRDEALADARRAVTRQQPRALAQLYAQLRDELDAADRGYREGAFEQASERLHSVLTRLRAHPELPGAAASAREAHLLDAKIAWARGEPARAEASLASALRLDPEARLSTRSAAPALVERYAQLQAQLLAQRDAGEWTMPTIVWEGLRAPPEGAELEIDGVVGVRPLPSGAHFVVLRREGHRALGRWVEVHSAWRFEDGPPLVATTISRAGAGICAALGLDQLVFAQQREAQLGLQVLACELGFGPLWVGPREQLEAGMEAALAGPFSAADASVFSAWPSRAEPPVALEAGGAGDDLRPWYRKGWVWGTSAGALALAGGAIAAGILLSGSGASSVEVDAKDFIGAR